MKVRLRHRQLARHLAEGRLTQNAWARRLGLSRGHLSNLVNGNRPYPSPRTRKKLLETLDLDFDDLFELEVPGQESESHKPQFSNNWLRKLVNRFRKDEMQQILQELGKDIQYGLRSVRRNPGFSLGAILTLALAIGANSVIFSALEAFVLRSPDYPSAANLRVLKLDIRSGSDTIEAWSYPLFDDFRKRLDPRLEVSAYTETPRNYNLSGGDRPLPVQVEFVSPNYFELLGVPPDRGRTLAQGKGEVGELAVLSHSIAEALFGSARSVEGRSIRLNTLSLTVAGVMPASFRGLSDQADIWVPMTEATRLMFARRLRIPFAFWHQVLLKVPAELAESQIVALLQSAAAGTSEAFHVPSVFEGARMSVVPVPLGDHRLDQELQRSLLMLFGAVLLVLLIACANLANLMLVRGSERRRELALRASLGAGRHRIFRQLLTEAAVLGLLGGILALLLTTGGISLVEALKPPAIAGRSSAQPMQLNLTVLGFTFAVSILATLLFALAPAIRSSRTDPVQGLRMDSARSGRSGGRLRQGLIVAEVALALILLVGAGLLIQSLGNLLAQPVGFQRDLLTARIDLPSQSYSEAEARNFYTELLRRAASLPGVTGASLANCLPIESHCDRASLRIQGDSSETGTPHAAWVQMVDENFLPDLGIPLLAGRGVSAKDREGAQLVAWVNQRAARRFWPQGSPLGARIRPSIGFPEGEFAEVVGVVGNTKDQGLDSEASAGVYLSFRQISYRSNFVFLKGPNPSRLRPSLQALVSEMDPGLALWDTRLLGEYVGEAASQSRFRAALLGSFAALALALSLLGIYSVTSHSIANRQRELAIRKAFGADRRQLIGMVLRKGMFFVSVGLTLGGLGAIGLSRLLSNMLFGISPGDPSTLLGTILLLALTCLLACFIPARKATRLDPMQTLRCD